MTEETDISFWKDEDLEAVAEELLRKASDEQAWTWKVAYHPHDGDAPGLDFWTLIGESAAHGLAVRMVLGNVPWTSKEKLRFTKEGKTYAASVDAFAKIAGLKRLEIKLDAIGRETKRKDDEAEREAQAAAAMTAQQEKDREAKDLIDALAK